MAIGSREPQQITQADACHFLGLSLARKVTQRYEGSQQLQSRGFLLKAHRKVCRRKDRLVTPGSATKFRVGLA
jgi:hypothetical protein